MRELPDTLPTLEPPHGGLQRLQRRLCEPERRLAPRARIAFAVAAIAAVLAVALGLPPIMQRQRVDALAQRLRLQLQASPGPTGIRVNNGAALLLPSHDPHTRIYLVQVSASPTH